MAKEERDNKVLKFITMHPSATLREVGDKFGITTQMVYYIKIQHHYN
jgi:predicted transcriptional regulator